MWMRFIMMGLFSVTALTLFTFQGIEISQAIMSIFKHE